jgi:hypothetical protein
METSKIVALLAILVVVAYVYKRQKREGFLIGPSTATLVPERDLRSGLNGAYIRGPMSLSGVDFAEMGGDVAPVTSAKDKAVNDYVMSQDLLPDGTMGGVRHTDPMDTRQVTVELRSRRWADGNPWLIQFPIEPVHSIHRFTDVDKHFDRPKTIYDSYDPETASFDYSRGLVSV